VGTPPTAGGSGGVVSWHAAKHLHLKLHEADAGDSGDALAAAGDALPVLEAGSAHVGGKPGRSTLARA
jgi:hypothetical protein